MGRYTNFITLMMVWGSYNVLLTFQWTRMHGFVSFTSISCLENLAPTVVWYQTPHIPVTSWTKYLWRWCASVEHVMQVWSKLMPKLLFSWEVRVQSYLYEEFYAIVLFFLFDRLRVNVSQCIHTVCHGHCSNN